MNEFLKKVVQIILIVLLGVMVIANLLNLKWPIALGSLFLAFILGLIFFFLYKKKKLNGKLIKIISLALLIIGLGFRIYLFFNLKFDLKSDFALYYNTALEIMQHQALSQASYLTYNGYVCIYSSILAMLFKINTSVQTVIIFHLICELLTIYLIYKIIKKVNDGPLKYLLPSIWFILPTVIEANFLVSTETLFILLLALSFYVYLTIADNSSINLKNILKYFLLGILLSFTNYIRPLMIILIIAFICELIVKFKKEKVVFLLVTILAYLMTNFGFNQICENILKEPTRSGALAWSIYYGSNYDTNGYWNELDGITINQILNEKDGSRKLIQAALKRYQDLGVIKSGILLAKKYYMLWTDVNGNYNFLLNVTNSKELLKLKSFLEIISFIITLSLLMATIYNKTKAIKFKDDKLLIFDIFTIGYVLSNLIIVVNGRYNYPLFFLLIVLASNIKLVQNKDKSPNL